MRQTTRWTGLWVSAAMLVGGVVARAQGAASGPAGAAAAQPAAQDVSPKPVQGATGGAASQRRAEVPVEGLTRRDREVVAAKLPGEGTPGGATASELLLHGFEFDGNAVDTLKLHFRRISATAVEITSLAYSLGEWRFLVRDRASYYGLGEHFDTLNRAHTIVRNASQDNAGPKGGTTYKPMPFL